MLKTVGTAIADVIKLPLRPGFVKLAKLRARGRFMTPQGTFAEVQEDGIIDWPKAA